MTQNQGQIPGTRGQNPLNWYPPDRIPFESLVGVNPLKMENPNYEDLVHHIKEYRRIHHKTPLTRDKIHEHFMNEAKKRGIRDTAEGKGFWGDVWDGIKKVGSTLGSSALEGLSNQLANPSQSLSNIASLAPLLV